MDRPYSYSVAELLKLREKIPGISRRIENMGPVASSGLVSDSGQEVRRKITASSADLKSGIKKRDDTESSSLRLGTSHLGSESLQSAVSFGDGHDDGREELVCNGFPAYHGLQKTWKLQRRRFADRSSQPFPAPTGIEAQKADNFKMFYEAVVSPSHVRVTAGGRIVPNIRGISHSGARWDSENGCFEDVPNGSLEPQAQWLQGSSILHGEPNSPSNGALATEYTFFGPSAGQTNHSLSSGQKQSTLIKGFHDGNYDNGNINEVKISPPSQFDSSRPFMYNGQVVYPVPPDFHIPSQVPGLPVNMLGNPSVPHQPFVHQHGLAGQAPVQFAQSMIPNTPYVSQHGAMVSLPGFHPLGVPIQLGSMNQVVPNFLMVPQINVPEQPLPLAHGQASDLDRLQELELQLERLERQLRKCRDQTEKHHLMAKQVSLQSQIIGLQKTLGTPMTHLGLSIKDHPNFRPSSWGAVDVSTAQISKTALSLAQIHTPENKSASPAGTGFATVKTPPEKIAHSVKTDSPSTLGVGTKVADSDPLQMSSRKLLEAAAAMAAPFKPRSQQCNTDQVPILKNNPKFENIAQGYKDPIGVIDTNKLTNSEAAVSADISGFTALPRSQTMYGSIPGKDPYSPPINLQSFSSFPMTTAVPLEHPSRHIVKRPIEPYLCGYVPFGMSSNTAKPVHMLYRRELTEEERRARELYWGKAPPELSKGLPKFDGKDFYPPSPVKESSRSKIDRAQQNQNAHHNLNISSNFAQRVSAKSDHNSGEVPLDFKIDSPSELKPTNSGEAKLMSKSEDNERIAESKIGDEISSTRSWGPLGAGAVESSIPPVNDNPSSKGQKSVQDSTVPISYIAPPSKSAIQQQAYTTFQQRMLRSSPRTAIGVATDGLSSATARGYLTQYNGSAAASLAPSMSNVSVSSQVYKKIDNSVLPASVSSARVENRPLSYFDGEHEPLSAADLLRKVKLQVKEASDAGFKSNTKGIGPVYDGEDW